MPCGTAAANKAKGKTWKKLHKCMPSSDSCLEKSFSGGNGNDSSNGAASKDY